MDAYIEEVFVTHLYDVSEDCCQRNVHDEVEPLVGTGILTISPWAWLSFTATTTFTTDHEPWEPGITHQHCVWVWWTY